MIKLFKETDSANYWDGFYGSSLGEMNSSSFSEFVHKWVGKKSIILDIGCGSGRDSFYFANQGHEVLGIDRSEEAIKQNCAISKAEGKEVIFQEIDLKQSKDLKDLLIGLADRTLDREERLIVYLRFLLHSIDDETEVNLLNILSEYLNKGSYFAAEFRTLEDRNLSKVYDNHYRRYVDAEKLVCDMETIYKFKKHYFKKGTGFSIFKNEDPYLARVIMEKI